MGGHALAHMSPGELPAGAWCPSQLRLAAAPTQASSTDIVCERRVLATLSPVTHRAVTGRFAACETLASPPPLATSAFPCAATRGTLAPCPLA